MSNLVLVDTSVFVDYLRGSSDDTLSVLILNNQVLLSPVVRLELLSGVRKAEVPQLEKLLNVLVPIESFAIPKICEKLLFKAKGSGLLGGLPDLLILAEALAAKATLFSCDKKLVKLADKLKLPVISY